MHVRWPCLNTRQNCSLKFFFYRKDNRASGWLSWLLPVMRRREVLVELTAPDRFASLMAQEQQHWQQHLAPLLARYTQNEARLRQLMAAHAQQQQQQQQHVLLQEVLLASTQELGSTASNTSSSSRSSDLVMDLVPAAAAARIQGTAVGTGGDGVCTAQLVVQAAPKL
jgi:DNA-binding helix-hairpin-helix protein with protein kinase domain